MPGERLEPVEAERALLGAVLILSGVPEELDLETSHFSSERNARVWRAVQELRGEGAPVDLVTVSQKLRGKVSAADLASLTSAVPCTDPGRLGHYAGAVKRAALYRKALGTLRRAVGELRNGARPPGEVLAEVSAVSELASRAVERLAPRTETLADLEKKAIPPPRWAVPGLVPEGITNLAGRPKAGKSLAALDLALAVAFGGKALGALDAVQGEVLYLALEVSEGGLQDLVRRYLEPEGIAWPTTFHYATTWKPLGEGGLGELASWLTERPKARLVVVDTLAKIRRQPSARGNVYAEDYAELGALQSLALNHRVAILLVTHTSKRNLRDLEDPADAITGSTAVTAVAEVNIVLTRVDAGRASARLIASGRRIPRQDLALDFDPSTLAWTILGDACEFQQSEARQEIAEVLRGAKAAMSPREIARALDKKEPAVKNLLRKLCREGIVARISYGNYALADRCFGDGATNGDSDDSRFSGDSGDPGDSRRGSLPRAPRVTALESPGDSSEPRNGTRIL